MNLLFALACLAILANLAFAEDSVDYCKLNCYDTSGWKNIGCGKTLQDKPGVRCSKDIKVYTFSKMDSHREHILDRHNKLRNQIAGGDQLAKFPIAERMLPMQWDDELSKLAFYNLKECMGEYDSCHRTLKYNNPGQNLAFFRFEEGEIQPTESTLIDRAASDWVDGWKSLEDPVKDIASFPAPAPYSGDHTARPFATMILDKNLAVGCSAANYTRDTLVYTMLCNYAYTIETGDRVFKNSSEPASGCTQKNERFSNLCGKADTDASA